ncbi:molybdopterin molybdotransferase MoeA, partial [Actinotalea sp. C106]|uniref:molybdopterin molybdotransferase MoeA n=1 Tax=Actinotalea sp. C106 TaxID=2908644 RepID=UPI002029940E
AAGTGTVRVHRRPRVAVLSTGDELVPAGDALRHGQIHDSNSVLLAACVRAAGAEPVVLGPVRDDPAVLRALLVDLESGRAGGSVDALVTSGGVSMGAYDVVKQVLGELADVELVKVAMQPGKPQGLGRLPGGTPVLALPGNPVSVFVSFEVLVRPVLLAVAGRDDLERPEVVAEVTDGWSTPPGRTQFMPVVLEEHATGARVRRAVAGGSGSHLVAGLARAEGLAVIDAAVEAVAPGDKVRVMLVTP